MPYTRRNRIPGRIFIGYGLSAAVYYTEDFETEWFFSAVFNQLFTEDFETEWFFSAVFNQLFTENFESGW